MISSSIMQTHVKHDRALQRVFFTRTPHRSDSRQTASVHSKKHVINTTPQNLTDHLTFKPTQAKTIRMKFWYASAHITAPTQLNPRTTI